MLPTCGEIGEINFNLATEVGIWTRQKNLGEAFDSSTRYDFTAIESGKISPDVSWIEKSRLIGVEIAEFIPIVTDLVIELWSATDNLKPLQEYRRLGVKLGLLINLKNQPKELTS